MKLITRQPKRIFTFGCSFTHFYWATWAEILGKDLNIPLYNFGRSGGGNQYITNAFSQANAMYKFTKDDLIVVSWTNVCREDRWIDGRGWVTPGNIFTQGEYSEEWVAKFADPIGMLVRDLASISMVRRLLDSIGAQWHFLSMIDIVNQFNQAGNINEWTNKSTHDVYKQAVYTFKDDIKCIKPSFVETLWNNDLYKNKIQVDHEKYNGQFSDGHPTPAEHYKFLRLTFDEHEFKPETKEAVLRADRFLEDTIREYISKTKDYVYIFDMNAEKIKYGTEIYRAVQGNII